MSFVAWTDSLFLLFCGPATAGVDPPVGVVSLAKEQSRW